MKRTPLTRTTGFAPRKKPLPTRSAARIVQQATQRRAYAAADDADQGFCSVCGRPGPVEHSHLFTQKAYPEHRANPLNWLLKCRGCHQLFENHKTAFAQQFAEAWRRILAQMQQVDSRAYAFFRMKHPY